MAAIVPSINPIPRTLPPVPDASFVQLIRYRLRRHGEIRYTDFTARDAADALRETKRLLGITGDLTITSFRKAGGVSVRQLPDGPQIYPPVLN